LYRSNAPETVIINQLILLIFSAVEPHGNAQKQKYKRKNQRVTQCPAQNDTVTNAVGP
jgi:hypothetical protein